MNEDDNHKGSHSGKRLFETNAQMGLGSEHADSPLSKEEEFKRYMTPSYVDQKRLAAKRRNNSNQGPQTQ